MSEVAAPAAPAAAAPAAAPSAPAASAEVTTDLKTAATAPAPLDGEAKPVPKPDDKPESRDDKGRDRRKMSRLYREAAEWKAKAEFFEKQAAETRVKEADPNAPKLEQFSDIEKFAEAREKYAAEKALKEHSAKQRGEAQKQAQAKLVEGWEGKVERADEKYEDFQSVVGDITPTSPWAVALMEAENGEDIAYFLGKNIEEAKRIAQLTPQAQFREIGKLEAKLMAAPPKPQQPSKAPAPIAPLTGTTTAAPAEYKEGMPMEGYMKLREQKGWSARRR